MQIQALVTTWQQVKATRSRLKKVDAVQALLTSADPGDVPTIVSYLSGELPQGRIGLGYATVGATSAEPATASSLSVADVDAVLTSFSYGT